MCLYRLYTGHIHVHVHVYGNMHVQYSVDLCTCTWTCNSLLLHNVVMKHWIATRNQENQQLRYNYTCTCTVHDRHAGKCPWWLATESTSIRTFSLRPLKQRDLHVHCTCIYYTKCTCNKLVACKCSYCIYIYLCTCAAVRYMYLAVGLRERQKQHRAA